MSEGRPVAEMAETDARDTLARAVERFLTPRSAEATARDEEWRRRGTDLPLACGLAATAWGAGPTVLLAHGWESRESIVAK